MKNIVKTLLAAALTTVLSFIIMGMILVTPLLHLIHNSVPHIVFVVISSLIIIGPALFPGAGVVINTWSSHKRVSLISFILVVGFLNCIWIYGPLVTLVVR